MRRGLTHLLAMHHVNGRRRALELHWPLHFVGISNDAGLTFDREVDEEESRA